MARQMKDSGIEWIGEIPERWQRDKVVRAFSLIGSGTTPKSTDEEQYGGTINWIQSGDINGGVMSSCKNTITEQTLQEYSALKVYQAPFIILAMYGASVGNLSISTIDGCVNQACCVLSMSKCNFQYAFYTLKAAKDYLLQKAVGGGQPNISQDIIRSLWIPQPELEEQQRIAAFLDCKCAEIDAVIERTKATIEEYKKLKQAVITEAVTKGVRGPRPMKDSGIEWIGEIPEGWNQNSIKNIADTCSGGTPTSNDESMYDGDINWVCSYDLHERPIIESGRKITEAGADSIAGKLQHRGSVLIAMYGGAGTIGNSGILECEARTNQAICSIKFNNKYVLDYYGFYYIMAIRKHWMMYAVGTRKDPNISQDIVKRMRCIIPPIVEQQEIIHYLNEKCAALDTLIAKKTSLLTELETYKKSLIYEYVTGKKKVP